MTVNRNNLLYITNRGKAELNQNARAEQSSLRLRNAENIPTDGPFVLTIGDERILCAHYNDSNGVVTVTQRGFDNSTAATHTTGDLVSVNMVAAHQKALADAAVDLQGQVTENKVEISRHGTSLESLRATVNSLAPGSAPSNNILDQLKKQSILLVNDAADFEHSRINAEALESDRTIIEITADITTPTAGAIVQGVAGTRISFRTADGGTVITDLKKGQKYIYGQEVVASNETVFIFALFQESTTVSPTTPTVLFDFPDNPTENSVIILGKEIYQSRHLFATDGDPSNTSNWVYHGVEEVDPAAVPHASVDHWLWHTGAYVYREYDTRLKQSYRGTIEEFGGWKWCFFGENNPGNVLGFVRAQHSGTTSKLEVAVKESVTHAIRTRQIQLPLTDSTAQQLVDALSGSGNKKAFDARQGAGDTSVAANTARSLAVSAGHAANSDEVLLYDYRNYRVGLGISFVGYLGRINPAFTNAGLHGPLNPGRTTTNDLGGHGLSILFWNNNLVDSSGSNHLIHGHYADDDFDVSPTNRTVSINGEPYKIYAVSTTNFGRGDAVNALIKGAQANVEVVYNDDTPFSTSAFGSRIRLTNAGGWERLDFAERVRDLAILGHFNP